MDRALPARMVDLIRDGVPPYDLKAHGGKAIYAALCSTAASASQRGWDQWEWEAFIEDPGSRLGVQVKLRDRVRLRSRKSIRKMYDGAWESATAWVSEQPKAFSSTQMKSVARERATALQDYISDPEVDLRDEDRKVLSFAAQEAARRGMDRIALPRRDVMRATGLGERTVRTTLERLSSKGLLPLAERGRQGTANPRANLYRLPEAPGVPLPVNGSVGPLGQICGTPAADATGTLQVPSQSSVGPLEVPPVGSEQDRAVTITLTARNVEDLAAAVALLRGQPELRVDAFADVDTPLPDNVTPLRQAGGDR